MSFVAGIGKVNIDLIFSGVESLPNEGEEIYSKAFDMMLGGGAVGTIVNLNRLEVPVKLFTYLGKDVFSLFAKNELLHHSVPFQNLHTLDSSPLNITSVVVTKKDRTFISFSNPYSESMNTPSMLYQSCKNATAVIMQAKSYIDVYKQLKAGGVKLLFDPGFDEDMSIGKYKQELEIADVYLPNRLEALKITNATTIENAAKILSFIPCVIIKLDSDGAFISCKDIKCYVSSMKCNAYKDSTGAGDAFLAGFIYGLYKRYELKKCVMCGNILGSNCVSKIGALSYFNTASELETQLELFSK